MSASDRLFAGSIPEAYHRYLVPLIFEVPAQDLVQRLISTDPTHILETAAGTGVVTREMAFRLPASARIVATDLNQAMLDQAASALTGDARITWRQADALALAFPKGSFDAVVCQFGVMFFSDKVQGYREAKRVLKPSGTFFFSVWDRIAENEFADVVSQALAALFPKDPPAFMARTPHGYHDVAHIRRDLTEAGFSSVQVATLAAKSTAPSARDVAIAFCQGTPMRHEIEARDISGLEEATQTAAAAIARRFGDGVVAGRIQAHVFVARP
jgi:ubiquinone/menaquinone biosynthesis C-methylase UbiE